MYGKNSVAKARTADDGFLVHSIFYTLQGEGPFAGLPAIFLRLANCNLRCFFCDTEFEKVSALAGGGHYSADVLGQKLVALMLKHRCELIVITGGEPMLQPLPSLFDSFADMEVRFQIETAGTCWPEGLESWFGDDNFLTIVTSPKTGRVLAEIEKYTNAWKYIIRAGETDDEDGLPNGSTQLIGSKTRLYRPDGLGSFADFDRRCIFVQPCDEAGIHKGRANVEEAARIAMKYGYRLSLQLHKIAGLD
jgi:organic radical activating enzyme